MTATTTPTAAILSATWGEFAADGRNNRRRVRGVATDSGCALRAMRMIANGSRFAAVAGHGGGVPNNYGYAATTDGVVYLAVRDGSTISVVVLAGELPANKVSLAGVGGLFGLRDCFDGRVGDARRAEARTRAEAMARAHIAAGRVRLTVVLSDEVAEIVDDAALSADARREAICDLFGIAGDYARCNAIHDIVMEACRG